VLLLPPSVARFQIRARRRARRIDDQFSLSSVTQPPDLRRLLRLASGAETVVGSSCRDVARRERKIA
jgi:hypothetical protein